MFWDPDWLRDVDNKFSVLVHTADLKIRVTGSSLEELFKNALIAMFQSIKPEAPGCKNQNGLLMCPELPQKHLVEVQSSDKESLLIDFLSEALYLSDVHGEAYLDAQIHTFAQTEIMATLRGVKVTGFTTEIKAVTYHDVHIVNQNDVWSVDIVFDI